jgi:mannose-1-phosphate guanylyltransferase
MLYAVILAGGSGTRLWPLSRSRLPKQLIPMVHGRSLLEEAWHRLEGVVPEDRRFVCAAERYRAAVTSQVPALRPRCYIGEPESRNTLAAIALSCSLVVHREPEAIVAILSADHVTEPADGLRAALKRASSLVESDPGLLVTFGIPPTRADTGYGYLELGEDLAGGAARRVVRFREKPARADAQRFFSAGPERFLWNSGMFLWRASRFLELVGRYEPALAAAVAEASAAAGSEEALRARLAAVYPGVKAASVDYGVMEPASRDPDVTIATIGIDVDWADVGSWTAYRRLLERDASGNAVSEGVLLAETRDTTAVSTEPGHLVACLGCEDMVIVHTPDATLVCPRSRADDIRKLYAMVMERDGGRFG